MDALRASVRTGEKTSHIKRFVRSLCRVYFVDLFVQVLKLCGKAGLLDLEHVSVDGSKVNANASKHKAMSYGRMQTEIERLEKEIREFSLQAERVDAEEDELYGKGRQAHEISEELRRRENRLERIAEASRGFRRFSLRGMRKVSSEWTLVCLCGNLLKLLTTKPESLEKALQTT